MTRRRPAGDSGTDLGEADATCESGSRDPLDNLTVLLEEKNAMTANTSIDPAESWRSSWPAASLDPRAGWRNWSRP
jgi:hypothetical protein